MNNYTKMITFERDEKFDVNYINEMCRQNPNDKFLIVVQNTKGITSSAIRNINYNVGIRIVGPSEIVLKNRKENSKIRKFNNGESFDYVYRDSLIYSKNETIKILEEIEQLENGIQQNWSKVQKLVYIYNYLKTNISYDPQFETKPSKDTRSLRGLLSKKTVCAGYSIILKELLNRQGIKCSYEEGQTSKDPKLGGGHAWNLVAIGRDIYPIDLTWENGNYRQGNINTTEYLGNYIERFKNGHIPYSWSSQSKYEGHLKAFDQKFISEVMGRINTTQEYNSQTFIGNRKNGTRFAVSQLGFQKINNKIVFRYYFTDYEIDGTQKPPLILYSETNIAEFINKKTFNETYTENLGESIKNVLFSEANIMNSIRNKTCYIGSAESYDGNSNKKVAALSLSQISKDENIQNQLFHKAKYYQRNDGTMFILQQRNKEPYAKFGINYNKYDVLETIIKNGKKVVKRNTIFSESDLLNQPKSIIANEFLSRERIDQISQISSGYVGFLDTQGKSYFNPQFVEEYKLDKTVEKKTERPLRIPSFEELKQYAIDYEITYLIDESGEMLQQFVTRDRKTKEVINDDQISTYAIMANLWLYAAKTRTIEGEEIPGLSSAFNETTQHIYEVMCKRMLNDTINKGVIDTVDLLQSSFDSKYKYTQEIIVQLFRTPYQTELLNTLFMKVGNPTFPKTEHPETLYNLNYAGNLIHNTSQKTL